MRIAGLLVGLMALTVPAPAQAASTLTLTVPTADPVEERPLEVTAAGSLDASRVLFIFVRPETAAQCGATAADEYAKAGVVELTGAYSWRVDGDPVAAGAYSRTRPFVPPLAQAYRLCAYVAASAGGMPDATATTTVAPRRATASVVLSSPPEPAVEEGPVAVTASGATENARKLLVFAESSATDVDTCATTASGEHQKSSARTVIGSLTFGHGGEALGAGEFSQREPFVPATAGRYRLCAYVYRDPAAAPYATATRIVEVSRASATAGITIATADPVEEGPVSVVTAGTTERPRNLLVAVESGASDVDTCASTWNGEIQKVNTTELTTGDAIAPERYSQAHSYVPAEPGRHRVCAYVQRSGDGHVYAFATRIFEVRRATADVSLTASTDRPAKGHAFTVTASGATERTRRLWVFVESGIAPGATCSGNAASEDAKSFSAKITNEYFGDAVAAPRFVESRPFTPSSDGPRLVCAYLQQEEAGTPYATASLLVGQFAPSSAPPPVAAAAAKLTVTRLLRPGRTRRDPGRTTLLIRGEPGTAVEVRIRRGWGREKKTAVSIGASGSHSLSFRWSCARTGTHRYEVSGRRAGVPPESVRGSWSVSRRRCRSLPRR